MSGGMTVRASARRMAQARLVGLLLVAAVVAAGAAQAAGASAPPRLVANAPSFQVTPFNKCTPLRPIILGDNLKYQWEETWWVGRPQEWTPMPGENRPSLCITYQCTLGYNPAYRLVAVNSAGRVATRPTVVSAQLVGPSFLSRPPPVVTRVAGRSATVDLEWVLARDEGADAVVLVVTVSPGRNAPVGSPYEKKVVASRMRGPLHLSVSIPQTQAWSDTVLTARAMLQCNSPAAGGPGEAGETTLEPVRVRILGPSAVVPPKVATCPPDAVNADYDGWVIRAGDASPRLPSCGDCRKLCADTDGCTTWVYGAASGSPRAGQCWLKWTSDPYRPTLKDTSPTGPWMSGLRPGAAQTCPGTFGVDLDGEVLVRGDANRLPNCAACADACDKLPGCNVWVWGYLPSNNRYKECWLKSAAPGREGMPKPGSGVGSPWVSNVIR